MLSLVGTLVGRVVIPILPKTLWAVKLCDVRTCYSPGKRRLRVQPEGAFIITWDSRNASDL